jgi:hypothetical protein
VSLNTFYAPLMIRVALCITRERDQIYLVQQVLAEDFRVDGRMLRRRD